MTLVPAALGVAGRGCGQDKGQSLYAIVYSPDAETLQRCEQTTVS